MAFKKLRVKSPDKNDLAFNAIQELREHLLQRCPDVTIKIGRGDCAHGCCDVAEVVFLDHKGNAAAGTKLTLPNIENGLHWMLATADIIQRHINWCEGLGDIVFNPLNQLAKTTADPGLDIYVRNAQKKYPGLDIVLKVDMEVIRIEGLTDIEVVSANDADVVDRLFQTCERIAQQDKVWSNANSSDGDHDSGGVRDDVTIPDVSGDFTPRTEAWQHPLYGEDVG